MSFKDSFLSFINEYELIEQGDTVLAGVSGGADSVCLLLLLDEVKDEIGFDLRVLHVEHGIRGEESLRDRDFVLGLCDDLGVRARAVSVDAPVHSKEQGLSLEEGARDLRYNEFRKEAKRLKADEGAGCVKIAVAHQADDNVETVLFQMSRGTGLKGFSGMDIKRDDIIRPLLFARRYEVEDYLKERGFSFRNDSTNEDTAYARNFIRHEIIPKFEELNPEAVSHIAASIGMLREANFYFENEAARLLEEYSDGHGDIVIEKIVKCPQELRAEVLHLFLRRECPNRGKDIGRVHVEALEELLSAGVGKRISLPGGYEAVCGYDSVSVRKAENEVAEADETRILLPELRPGEECLVSLPDGSSAILRNIGSAADAADREIPRIPYTKWFDYDKIKRGLVFRHRLQGDLVLINKEGGRKKLKDYLIDKKVPKEERDALLLLCTDENVHWIVGDRSFEGAKVTEHTPEILEIEIRRNS